LDIETFRRELRSIAPKVGELAARESAKTASYNLIERNPSSTVVVGDRTLSDLFSKFDPSSLEIGMVRFPPEPTEVDNGWVVAIDEADPIILSNSSGRLHVEDHASPGFVICECAIDGGAFLSALLPLARYLSEWPRLESAADVLNDCVERAGGEAFRSFYRTLLRAY